MTDSDLMTIGAFSRLSGLSVHTLRHYDDVGLLAPATVDPDTGYRRYGRDQLPAARIVHALRWIDLPVDDVRTVLDGLDGLDGSQGDGAVARQTLTDHRHRLDRQAGLLAARIADVDRYLQKGISMTPLSGCRPVQLKIAVDDLDAAIGFYQEAFGFHYDVTRRTDEADYSSFMFGTYGEDDFFLVHLVADPAQTDRPGRSTFGLLVDDLTAHHRQALAAGATELAAPHDAQGMPRSSAIEDPSGNRIWLYQG